MDKQTNQPIISQSSSQTDDVQVFCRETRALICNTVLENATGLLAQMAMEHLANPGKMLRAKMIFRLGQVFRVPRSYFTAWAASVEILHNASLVHDDLQDGDEFRRGQQTIWARYGHSQAINLGDFFILIALQPVLVSSMDPVIMTQLCKLFSTSSVKLVNGQSFESQLNQLDHLHDLRARYNWCISQKTSAIFSLLVDGIAAIAKLDSEKNSLLSQIFLLLGNIFQIQDDLLDLYGDKQRNEVGCDIREGKVSILVAQHLTDYPNDFSRLKQILQKPRSATSESEVSEVIQLFVRSGTLERVLQELDGMVASIDALISKVNDTQFKKLVDVLVQEILQPVYEIRNRVLS